MKQNPSNLTIYQYGMMADHLRSKGYDYATASATLSKSQIVQQAATAMLAQANQQPQSVLSLLK